MRRRFHGVWRDRSGATAVEFAIIAPLIFMSVLGTFETGRALYVRNHMNEAAAAGARQAIISGNSNNSAIEAAIRAKFKSARQADLTVNQTNEVIGGRNFKKIELVYSHDFIVNFGRGLSGLTFTAERYAPG
jgi:Flp pilus assembly protein TadG